MIPPSLPTPPASTTESVIGCEEVSSQSCLPSSSAGGSPPSLNAGGASDSAAGAIDFDIFDSLAADSGDGVSPSVDEALDIDLKDDVTALLLDEVRRLVTNLLTFVPCRRLQQLPVAGGTLFIPFSQELFVRMG